MSTISPIHLEAATPAAQQLVLAAENHVGHPSNMLRTMAHSPAILEAYMHFNRAFQQPRMSTRLRGLLTMAIAQVMGSEYILSVAVALGTREGITLQELEAARCGDSEDSKIALALGFAISALREAGKTDPSEVAALQEAGYSDEEIVEIIGIISLNFLRNFFNLIVQTEVDFPHIRTTEPIQKDLGSQAVAADR